MNTTTTQIVIDEEFKSLIPPLTKAERDVLESSVLDQGCLDRLAVWKGHDALLDGHHRHEICGRHNIAFDVVEIDLSDRDAAKAWIIRNQFGRRNLTPFQRAELALQLECEQVCFGSPNLGPADPNTLQ